MSLRLPMACRMPLTITCRVSSMACRASLACYYQTSLTPCWISLRASPRYISGTARRRGGDAEWEAELARRREKLRAARPLGGRPRAQNNNNPHVHNPQDQNNHSPYGHDPQDQNNHSPYGHNPPPHGRNNPHGQNSHSQEDNGGQRFHGTPLTEQEYRQLLHQQQVQRLRFQAQEEQQAEQRAGQQAWRRLKEVLERQRQEQYHQYYNPQHSEYQHSGYQHSGYQEHSGGQKTASRIPFWMISVGCAVVFFVYNTERVPVSGRLRFSWLPEGIVRKRSERDWPDLFTELTDQVGVLPANDPRTRLVNKVLTRLLLAADQSDIAPNLNSVSDSSPWKVYVLDSPDVNAAVLPHRVILVFSGLFRLATHEAEIASVLSHELGHHLASHAREQASNGLTLRLFAGGVIALAAAQRRWMAVAAALVVAASGVLDVVADWPLRRQLETEADLVGIALMADACYDPRAAASWWRKVMAVSKGDIPEFASTHPPHQKRLERVLNAMPAALERYNRADCARMQSAWEALRMRRVDVQVPGRPTL